LRTLCFGALALLLPAASAHAELSISQLIIEFIPGQARTADVEIYNDSTERSFVSVEPSEIVSPGTASERRVTSPDPGKLGLLVSPHRLVLEPKQRRLLRVATITGAAERERVYRVTVKPLAGEVTGSESGLKLLVGYDLLVLARPARIDPVITPTRAGRELTIANRGNVSVELLDGKQCNATGSDCRSLAKKRIYAGASWTLTLPHSTSGEFRVRAADKWSVLKF
jgi:P pilus assembly chaperone PapD